MAYGVKRGIKSPGEFGFSDMFGLALAGSTGIIAALVTDYQQKGEASAMFTINQWVVSAGSFLGIGNIPLWMVALGLVILGGASIFYFQPITRQGAFAQGFGLLAVMMTAVPADLAGGLESMNDLSDLEASSGLSRQAAFGPGGLADGSPQGGIVSASFAPAIYSANGQARVIQAQSRSTYKYDVVIKINFPDGVPSNVDRMIRRGDLRGRLHNEETGETWNLFRSAGGTLKLSGDVLTVSAGVPTRTDVSRLWVRVEAAGYAIEEQSAVARKGERLNWNVNMTPSSTPLFVQRLNKSFWF